ncbi:MAG: DNA-binding response regulator, partial [Nakamurella sp.]
VPDGLVLMLDLVRSEQPEVLLVDLRMPCIDRVAATRQVLARTDPPAVVVLRMLWAIRAAAR